MSAALYQAFDAHVDEYDAWYDSQAGSAIFAMEVECLRPFLHRHRRPYLEIGVGSGRFAQALGVEYGIDPALALLHLAKARVVQVLRAAGEELPFPDKTFGGILIALTLCFVHEPKKVLQEAFRVLQPGGGLVLGLILKGSPWAEYYHEKGKQGHPIFSKARFFIRQELESLLKSKGFENLEYRSVLFQPPGQDNYYIEQPVSEYNAKAGFVAIKSICLR